MCRHKNSGYKTAIVKRQHSVDLGRGCVGRNDDAGDYLLTGYLINDRLPCPVYNNIEFLVAASQRKID